MIGHAGLAHVGIGSERVRHEAEAGGVQSRLRKQPRLDDGDERGAVVGGRLEDDDGLAGVLVPVPVLRQERFTGGAGLGQNCDRRAASCEPGCLARLRRVDDLGADVQREHVSRVDSGAFRDPVDLPEEPVVVLGDGRLETAGLGKHPGPVPARQVAEDVAIRVDRSPDAVASLLAVGASTLLGAPRDPDVRVRGRHGRPR